MEISQSMSHCCGIALKEGPFPEVLYRPEEVEHTKSKKHTVFYVLRNLQTVSMEHGFYLTRFKNRYWQIEWSAENIPLTVFTVGPLGFYDCVCMPFGLMNASVTFQSLMESCLRDMHLDWSIIYLEDIIIFSKDS